MDRRTFLALGIGAACDICFTSKPAVFAMASRPSRAKEPFKISLAEWSFHNRLFGRAEPKLDNLDFAAETRALGIDGVEYVNTFFKDKVNDKKYLTEMKKRAADNGVTSVLIMCDNEGRLGDPDDAKRSMAVQNHCRWVDAAKFLGCHAIRVNAQSDGSFEEQQKLIVDGMRRLAEYASLQNMNVLIENHGGLSSDPKWLTGIFETVNLPNFGSLPDFGNFPGGTNYCDAVEAMMPWAKSVSAKSQVFNENGDEANIDFYHMMRIVRDHGYTGFVGIEYGVSDTSKMSEKDGIIATKKLLKKIREQQKLVKPIFNGRNLDGWQIVDGGDWTIQDGVLIGSNGRGWSTDPEKNGSWLRTKKIYSDFRLELQYAINSRGNSGVHFRSAAEKNPSFTGYEMQISDAFGREPSERGAGAIYTLAAPTENLVRPADQWNTVTIIAKGPRIIVEMNGKKTVDTELTRSMSGYIGLQNHDERSIVKFRNIRLQEL